MLKNSKPWYKWIPKKDRHIPHGEEDKEGKMKGEMTSNNAPPMIVVVPEIKILEPTPVLQKKDADEIHDIVESEPSTPEVDNEVVQKAEVALETGVKAADEIHDKTGPSTPEVDNEVVQKAEVALETGVKAAVVTEAVDAIVDGEVKHDEEIKSEEQKSDDAIDSHEKELNEEQDSHDVTDNGIMEASKGDEILDGQSEKDTVVEEQLSSISLTGNTKK